jgi:hypothetical protein
MADPEQARATQLRNIEAKTGKDLVALRAEIAALGNAKHGEIRAWLIANMGLTYGDANALAHAAKLEAGAAPSSAGELDDIYAGKKEHLRPIHDAIVSQIEAWGDFEIAPKKGYVALRRKKQFAMLGPKTADRAELGINLKDDVSSERIVAQKPGGMCQFAVALTGVEDFDAEVIATLRRAFDAAG